MNETPRWHEAYQVLSKHLFIAYPICTANTQKIIIIADTLDQAKILAERHWLDRRVCVRHVQQLENIQIYE